MQARTGRPRSYAMANRYPLLGLTNRFDFIPG